MKKTDILLIIGTALCIIALLFNSNTEYLNEFDLTLMEREGATLTESGVYIDESSGMTGEFLSSGTLSLGPANYELTLKYTSVGNPVIVRIHESDGTSQEMKAEFQLTEGYKIETFSFTTGVRDKYISVGFDYAGAGSFQLQEMTLYSRHAYRDDIALAVILAVAVAFVRYLIKKRNSGQLTDRMTDFVVVFLAAVFVTYASFTFNIRFGHDNYFHLSRIESVKDQILAGIFPSRVYVTAYKGYGYAAPTFYPDLFLYIPAFMRVLGMSQSFSYAVLFLVANLIAGYSMYYAADILFGKRHLSLTASILYLTALYRLTDIIGRAAVGEAYAMSFLPLVIGGMYSILTDNGKKWWILTAGITGILQAHVLSTMMTAMFCGLTVVLLFPGLIKDRRALMGLIRSLGLAVLLNLWFLVPFVQSYLATKLQTNNIATTFWLFSQPISEMLVFFPRFLAGTYAGGGYYAAESLYGLGAAITILCIAFPVIWFFSKKEKKEDKRVFFLLALGVLAFWMSTDLFPWKTICAIPFIGPVFSMIQFPWRFMSVSTPLMALVGAYTAERVSEDYQVDAKIVTVLVCVVALITGGVYIGSVYTSGTLMPNMVPIINGIDQYQEYLPVGIVHDEILERGDYILCSSGQITDYYRDNRTYRFSYEGAQEGAEVELPLMYYLGYQAKDENNKQLDVSASDGQLVKVCLKNESGTVTVSYGKTLWTLCDLVSLAGWIGFVWLFIRSRKRSQS